MAVNEVVTITVVGKVDAGVASGTIVTNTATVFSDTPDPVSANNTDTAGTTVTTAAALAVSKRDLTDPVNAGELLMYQIQVTNTGSSDALNVRITDTLPVSVTFVGAAAGCALSGG